MYKFFVICECILYFSSASIAIANGNYCQSKTQNTHLHLSTKTPYRFIVNKDDSSPTYEGCLPQKLWLIVRHGTRNPSQKIIRKMRERLPILQNIVIKNADNNRTSLCAEEIANLANWSIELEEADEKRLTHEGEDEMIELAERFQNRFKELLSDNYTNSTIKFRYTATQRTAESARHFTVGLYGRRVSRYVWFPEAIYRDPILRFYKLCPRWRSEIKKNPEAWKDKQLFESSAEMKETLLDISSRLGLANLTVDDAALMYMTCAFETAWHWNTPAPWCAAFSERNLEVMEYYYELEYYWVDGYGHNLTYKQACPVIRDLFHFFEGEGPWEQEARAGARAVVAFTHSGTLLKLLAHLGLYRDADVLRHDNFERQRTARAWRVSRIDAFGTNFAVVLYRCGGGEERLLALHQERPVPLPGCPAPATDLCPVETVRRALHQSLHDCDFDAMCAHQD